MSADDQHHDGSFDQGHGLGMPPSGQPPAAQDPAGQGPPAGADPAGQVPPPSGQNPTLQYSTESSNPYPPFGASPQTSTMPPVAQPRQTPAGMSSGKLVATVAALALVVGGAAGGIGGYLAADDDSSDQAVSALQQTPAKQTSDAKPGSVEAVAKSLTPAVVQIQVNGSQGSGEGSGFVISPDGYIITNNHVVAAGDGGIQVVFAGGKKVPAKVVGTQPKTDVAVIKAQGVSGLKTAQLGRSDDLNVGQQVVAIGSPFELAGTVTSGIVSAIHRPVTAGDSSNQDTVLDAIQTDAAINPGNSGGPLVDMNGRVIGINSAIYSPSSGGAGGESSEGGNVGIGFAIPIDQARRIAEELIKTGKAQLAYVGVQVRDASGNGASVGKVEAGSPGQKAGLHNGDVVTKIDDRVVTSANDLVAAVRGHAVGDKVTLTLSDGKKVQVTLGAQPN